MTNPVPKWLFPNEANRLDSIRRATTHGMRHQIASGMTWCTGDHSAVITWQAPDVEPVGLFRSLLAQASLAPLLLRFGPPIRTALSAARLFGRDRPTEPHYVLGSVATRPESQGRGIATELIAAGLRTCDEADIGCFLTSTNPRNVPLYERLGFETTSQLELPARGPTVTMMFRKPPSVRST